MKSCEEGPIEKETKIVTTCMNRWDMIEIVGRRERIAYRIVFNRMITNRLKCNNGIML